MEPRLLRGHPSPDRTLLDILSHITGFAIINHRGDGSDPFDPRKQNLEPTAYQEIGKA